MARKDSFSISGFPKGGFNSALGDTELGNFSLRE